EYVVAGVGGPRGFAVEDQVVRRQVRDGRGDSWKVLRQPVARQQADIRPVLERQQADAIELALEDPLGPGEPRLCERRRHRLDPVGKWRFGHGGRRTIANPSPFGTRLRLIRAWRGGASAKGSPRAKTSRPMPGCRSSASSASARSSKATATK